jgi:hypothetical protein
MKVILLALLCTSFVNPLVAQVPSDTIVVGKILSFDSVSHKINKDKTGYKYYYGSFHLKIEVNKKSIYVVKVFNMIEEFDKYLKCFNYKVGEKRIFYLYKTNLCNSGIPRIDGYCEDGFYYPLKSSVIKRYDMIYRVIHDSIM